MKEAVKGSISKQLLLKGFELMHTARALSELYEHKREICAKYVHSTSAGHEAIQLAAGLQLKEYDYASPYYRDDAMLLGIGITSYELLLSLLAKRNDPFSGGRTYYCHPSLKRKGFPTIPHQSSATGMQAIPSAGMAHGIAYLESQDLLAGNNKPIVLCSLGDGSVTEGEVAEAFQMSVLKQLPIIFLVQDNDWGISATGKEMRAMNAYDYAAGFKGLQRRKVDGADFIASYECIKEAIDYVREERAPILIHAKCPLLGHHTSGVRKEWYRGDDLREDHNRDPLQKLEQQLVEFGVSDHELNLTRSTINKRIADEFERAVKESDPDPDDFDSYEFVPTPIKEERGIRTPENGEKVVMVDAALHAIDEILHTHPEALLYGQDVGERLGGVFREAATLAKKYGKQRVFNTPIQEAYIIGSTAGMSAVGAKPIVEIQFADYIWPGINQLVEEISKSCYLTRGKFPVQSLIRVPIGAYGGGGPYHSGSIESTLLTIRGIKVVYPSNAADMKGLMKAAFYDPNPVIMLEHKGLYWSKVPGTLDAKSIEPDQDYIIPLGKGRVVLEADSSMVNTGKSAVVITYGMGVYWAREAAQHLKGKIEIIDLRTLNPLDWELMTSAVKNHGRVLIVTEQPLLHSLAESLAGRLTKSCFQFLDAPIFMCGAVDLPAIPLNVNLEKQMLPDAAKVREELEKLLNY
jgi:2-oxoisovalerate dehydrogenase E1 component